jgi:hypothetical protein
VTAEENQLIILSESKLTFKRKGCENDHFIPLFLFIYGTGTVPYGTNEWIFVDVDNFGFLVFIKFFNH